MKQTVYTRDVVLLMAAAFFYMCCSNSVAPIVAGYAESIGASSFWMGLISSLTTATAVVCRPVTGNLADKMDKRPLVVAGCLMMVAASAGYVLFPHVWCVAVLRVLHGTGYACCSIGMSTWLTLLLPPDRLASGVGAYGTVNALAMALAPVMGIRLKEFSGYRSSFLAAGFSALICILLVHLIGNCGAPVSSGKKRAESAVRRLVVPGAVPIAIALAIITIPYTANKSFLVSYVDRAQLEIAPDLFFSFYAVILVVLRMALRKQYDRVPYPRFLVLCTISMLGSMAALYWMRGYVLMLMGAVLMAAGYGIMYSVSQSAAASAAPPEQRGLAMGTYYLGLDIGSAVGPIIGGMLYGNVELQMFYPLLGVIGALCFVMYLPCKRVCGQNNSVHT